MTTVTAAPDVEPVRSRIPPWVDLAVRIVGFVVAVLLAVATATYEVFLVPLRWDGARLPVSVAGALVVNLALAWFTVVVTRRRIAVVGPAAAWMVVMVAAATRTSEGDLVLTDNNWVGIVTMLAGSLTFAVAGYRLVLTAFRPKV